MLIVPVKKQLVNEGFEHNGMTVLGQPFFVRCNDGKRRQYVVADCHCGRTFATSVKLFRRNHSCGCDNVIANPRRGKENVRFTHGGHKLHKRLYSIWTNMKSRCFNPRVPCFVHYGGKGVTVCGEWRNNFPAFRDWALANGYADTHSIDRIDSAGNYEPSNCRWLTMSANVGERNRSRRGISTEHRPPILRGEDSPKAKVTAAAVRAMRARRADGATYGDLMREFGLKKSQVARICRGQSWAALEPEAA